MITCILSREADAASEYGTSKNINGITMHLSLVSTLYMLEQAQTDLWSRRDPDNKALKEWYSSFLWMPTVTGHPKTFLNTPF